MMQTHRHKHEHKHKQAHRLALKRAGNLHPLYTDDDAITAPLSPSAAAIAAAADLPRLASPPRQPYAPLLPHRPLTRDVYTLHHVVGNIKHGIPEATLGPRPSTAPPRGPGSPRYHTCPCFAAKRPYKYPVRLSLSHYPCPLDPIHSIVLRHKSTTPSSPLARIEPCSSPDQTPTSPSTPSVPPCICRQPPDCLLTPPLPKRLQTVRHGT